MFRVSSGIDSRYRDSSVVDSCDRWVSTSGGSAVTLTASVSDPTGSSHLNGCRLPGWTRMSEIVIGAKPSSSALT